MIISACVPTVVLAQASAIQGGLSSAAGAAGISGGCTSMSCVVGIIGRIVNVALGFVGIILLVYLLYAGFLWMTAGGEADKVKDAISTIRNAVVGLIIIVFAFSISTFVLGTLSSATGVGTTPVSPGTGTDTTTPGPTTGPTTGGAFGASCDTTHPCATGLVCSTMSRTCATPPSGGGGTTGGGTPPTTCTAAPSNNPLGSCCDSTHTCNSVYVCSTSGFCMPRPGWQCTCRVPMGGGAVSDQSYIATDTDRAAGCNTATCTAGCASAYPGSTPLPTTCRGT